MDRSILLYENEKYAFRGILRRDGAASVRYPFNPPNPDEPWNIDAWRGRMFY